jgi:hypothetical protein
VGRRRKPGTLDELARRRGRMNPRLDPQWLRYLVSVGAERDADGWRWKINSLTETTCGENTWNTRERAEEECQALLLGSLYKILDERYGENANKQNVTYYDGNLENIQRFIFDYIYWYLFGETYASVEKNETQEVRGYSANAASNAFFFQVSSNEHVLFLKVTITNDYYDEARQLVRTYNGGNQVVLTKKVSKEELINSCNISFHSDTISGTDAIAYYLEKVVGVPINSENYLIALKSRVFKEISPSGYHRTTLRFPYGAQLKTMFTTDIKKMDEYVSFGVKTNSELRMSYENFIALMKYFNENRANLTFATSNTYFEKHKGDYILEQFLDDVQEDAADVVDIDMTEDLIQKEVSEMIDELVKLITKK